MAHSFSRSNGQVSLLSLSPSAFNFQCVRLTPLKRRKTATYIPANPAKPGFFKTATGRKTPEKISPLVPGIALIQDSNEYIRTGRSSDPGAAGRNCRPNPYPPFHPQAQQSSSLPGIRVAAMPSFF
jgi:hypothetical protein